MKKIIKFISGKLFITCILILMQIIAYFMMFYHISRYSPYIYGFITFLSLFFAFRTATGDLQSDFKAIWIFFLISVPIFSWIIYIIIRKKKISSRNKKFSEQINKNIIIPKDVSLLNHVNDDSIRKQINYIISTTEHSVYNKTITRFFPMGESFFKSLESSLEKAEKFIFLEYFIINKGNVWDRIYNILKTKAENGVEIRILYDDIGTVNLLPYGFRKNLEKHGIKSARFNPLTPYPDISINCRDHRKIAVIDGKYAYTGGINLSDEYSNEKERFGVWKDYGILIEGKAVKEMTAMFLKMWDYNIGKIEKNPNKYFSDYISENDGVVIPFGADPSKTENTVKNAYFNMISSARKYVYITTPYLIPDSEIVSALKLASKSGIDVRIIVPHIPDKWYVDAVTKANYDSLIKSGIKIYEYKYGFIHAKSVISDDKSAIIGTANFDYRSFYYLFENLVFLYGTNSVNEIKSDFLKTMSESIEISKKDIENRSYIKKAYYSFMKFFSIFM